MQSMPTSPVYPVAAAPTRDSKRTETEQAQQQVMESTKSMHGLRAHCWLRPSNSGLVSYLDWLFSAKKTKDNKTSAPGPGASPVF